MHDLFDRLDTAVRGEAWEDLAEIRHTIDGTARAGGATAIADLAVGLKEIQALEPTERSWRIEQIHRSFVATREAMRQFLASRKIEAVADATRL